MPAPILVIGSNSFSGASFVDYALKAGHDVIGCSRSAEPVDAFLSYRWPAEREGKFTFAQWDLNHHTAEMLDAVASQKIEYVVNFAAQSMVAQSWEYPLDWYQTNVMANVKLHDGLRKIEHLKQYVHISTPEVYGSCEGLVKEDHRFNPSTPYAASRAACDLHLNTFIANYGFPCVFTRAANVFGPGQQLYRIIPRTILYIKLGNKLQLHGGGHSVRSFIHIDDVSAGTLKAATNGKPGDVFHFSTDRHISIRDLVAMICDKMGASFEDVVEVVGDRPGKDAAYLLDTAKANHDLDWQAKISLEDGIAQSVDWVNEYFDSLKAQPYDYIHKA